MDLVDAPIETSSLSSLANLVPAGAVGIARSRVGPPVSHSTSKKSGPSDTTSQTVRLQGS